MSNSAYGSPLLIKADDSVTRLQQVPLSGAASTAVYDEAWLQDLVYRHPEVLPIAEIDDIYQDLVPVCRELNTPAGPVDVLYVTRTGRLIVVEAKLWRNPEARRKVVGQVLDYAKEFSRFSYETLDARVQQARRVEGQRGEPTQLFAVAKTRFPELEEHRFNDALTRSLQRGEFLLLIVGDGIREGVGAITEFLEGHGTLHFTFGLVEMAIYRMPDGGQLVQPRVLAQSAILKRIVVSVEGPRAVVDDDAREEEEATSAEDPGVSASVLQVREQFSSFWGEFLAKFEPRLQDKGQVLPTGSRSQNLYVYLPKGSKGWISAYVAQSAGCVGVYLTFERGPIGDRLFAALAADKDAINRELGVEVRWETANGKHDVSCREYFPGIILKEHREAAQEWMMERLNRFITTFRPRVEQFVRDSGGTQ